MDRKVLLAMVLIMAVLFLDQAISPRFWRPKPKPVPLQQGSGSQPGGSPGGSQGAGRTGAPGGTAPANPAAGTAAQATPAGDGSRPASPSGAALTRPEVPAAPAELRDLSTEHFQVTITSAVPALIHLLVRCLAGAKRMSSPRATARSRIAASQRPISATT